MRGVAVWHLSAVRESGGRCEVVASRGNSLAFRVVGVRLLQVVAILLLLEW